MGKNEKMDLRKLAERIYDLDEKVYRILGSSLGRVYNGDKERNIKYIIDLLESKNGAHILRDELALIGNMAKTIPDIENQSELKDEFSAILELTKIQADKYTRIDILDESRAQLNSLPLKSRFSEQDKKIICIGRTYGSGGDEVGFALANELGLNYYDKKIFRELLKRMETGKASVWDGSYLYRSNVEGHPVYTGRPFEDEQQSFIKQFAEDFKRYHGLPKRDALYFTESRLILELAKRENFVIMGRYADIVLRNEGIPHVNLFISAPFEKRVDRMMGLYPNRTEKQIRHMLKRSDARHRKDYMDFTGMKWGMTCYYDLTVNSASYGIPGTVALIMGMLESEIDYH